MPELPEVETLRRELDKAVAGKIIKDFSVDFLKMIRPDSLPSFRKKVLNKKILAVERHAKILFFKLSGDKFIIIHLKLTGQLIFVPENKNKKKIAGGHPQRGGLDNLPNKFTRAIFSFADGSKLFFNDLRKFGWLKMIDKSEVDKLVGGLGVEPLSAKFNFLEFKNILTRYPKRKIKQILLDQKLISGIGNIYADESCFCARILPWRLARSLNQRDARLLFICIVKILKLAISKKGTSADTYVRTSGEPGEMLKYLKVYGRKGKKCLRCSGRVERIKLNGRGTHYCDGCQK